MEVYSLFLKEKQRNRNSISKMDRAVNSEFNN